MRIGLDPEVAIVNKKTGVARSAHRFLKDDKPEVFRFYYDSDKNKTGYSMQGSEVSRDGAAMEVRSIVSSACRDNIIPYVGEALRQKFLDLQRMGWKGDWTFSSSPVYRISEADLKGAPKDVFEFGCRPDLDAYTLDVKDPQCPKGDLRRYTGGHIHYSTMGAKNDVEKQAALAILFDYAVNVPFVAILGERFAEGEAERRQFYGQPGSFRYDDNLDKIEFRSLSGRLLLSPVLMYWVLGMMKTMRNGINGDILSFLKEKMFKVVDPQVVFDTIMNHDYELAARIAPEIMQALPSYREDEKALGNPMSGGGGGTQNAFFFMKAMEVFLEGNRKGVTFSDDLQVNWGLYEDYEIKHHSYWGIQQAMVGLLDATIFPQLEVLPNVWPKEMIQAKPVWQHPLNGGFKKYVTGAAAGWLA